MKKEVITEYVCRYLGVCKRVFLHKKNLKRDAIVLGLALVISWVSVFGSGISPSIFSGLLEKFDRKESPKAEAPVAVSDNEIADEIRMIQDLIDTSSWKSLQSQWYGFEIKYPETWNKPLARSAAAGSKWEYKYQFNKGKLTDADVYAGFDLAVYNIAKTREVANTEEFPGIKNDEAKVAGRCDDAQVHLIETGDYPAEEIYVPQMDDCYKPALFFSFTRGEYIYNLVSVVRPGVVMLGDPRVEIADNFPEFFAAASSLKTIDIVRPKPIVVAPKPRITAPMPVSFKRTSKGLVCAKKKDHPGKSVRDKGKHMDMECCLDPDEYPNPNCYYSESKYGKYL